LLDTGEFDGYVADESIRQKAVSVPDGDVNGGQRPVVSRRSAREHERLAPGRVDGRVSAGSRLDPLYRSSTSTPQAPAPIYT